MYSFKRVQLGGLAVHVSCPMAGAKHTKKFTEATTPQAQSTFNVYVQGEFRFRVDGVVDQVLTAGQTTFDINAEFPAGSVAVEEVLSPVGIRYCVDGAVTKSVVSINSALDAAGKAVFVLDGSITYRGRSMTRGAYFLVPSGSISGVGRVALLGAA